MYIHISVHQHKPESNSEWQNIDECIDLEDAEEEDSEVLKCLGEEVPEETKVGRLVRHWQSVHDSKIFSGNTV